MGISLFIKNLFSALISAFTTLTRIPFPFSRLISGNKENMARSVIFFPVVGLFYGAVLYGGALLMRLLHLPLLLLCFIILILPYCLNKFFHFDGLCDVLDAFWADRTKKQRLRILKDSRIGSFALGGIIFFVLFKFILLYLFFEWGLSQIYLLAIPVFSRYGMVMLSYKSIYPKDRGTGLLIIGKISTGIMLASSLLFLFILLGMVLLSGMDTGAVIFLLVSVLASGMFVVVFKLYSYGKIGGITGDVLGASAEITEVLILITCLLLSYEKL
jgi:adenosylcobinamide-GDP ribazoletransferase